MLFFRQGFWLLGFWGVLSLLACSGEDKLSQGAGPAIEVATTTRSLSEGSTLEIPATGTDIYISNYGNGPLNVFALVLESEPRL